MSQVLYRAAQGMLKNTSQTCTWQLQVPLGTVIHKVAPAAKSEDHHHEEEEQFTFQQHWIGARDYVSSDEESEDGSSADEKDAKSDPNLEVIVEACYALAAWNGCVQPTLMLHHQHHLHHCDCCMLSYAVLHTNFAAMLLHVLHGCCCRYTCQHF